MRDFFSADDSGRRGSPAATVFLAVIGLLVVAVVGWASWAELDEVARGQGQVIPSRQIQVVQNLEGGIIAEILATEGQIVRPGDSLLRIDDTNLASSFRENEARWRALTAKRQRLDAEVGGASLVLPAGDAADSATVAAERALFEARRAELDAAIAVLERQAAQRAQEIAELDSRIQKFEQGLELAADERSILKPMVDQGVTSRIELIRLDRQITALEGDLDGARIAVPRVRAALSEARRRIDERRAAFVSRAREELAETYLRLSVLEQAMAAQQDRVSRTEVRSPVHGTVNRVLVNTVGGVVQPGMDLVEIVPLEDSLLVEARIKPADIAFLRPGQQVKVKITAYDFATFGTLEGRLEHISADSIADERGETYFQIRVRTDRNFLGSDENPLPIIPGMVAEVDILTGERTVLDYFFSPLAKVSQRALTEH